MSTADSYGDRGPVPMIMVFGALFFHEYLGASWRSTVVFKPPRVLDDEPASFSLVRRFLREHGRWKEFEIDISETFACDPASFPEKRYRNF